ncbi:hypothetical protein Bhyg_11915, partial [Pseudolycoriella hygida]
MNTTVGINVSSLNLPDSNHL